MNVLRTNWAVTSPQFSVTGHLNPTESVWPLRGGRWDHPAKNHFEPRQNKNRTEVTRSMTRVRVRQSELNLRVVSFLKQHENALCADPRSAAAEA